MELIADDIDLEAYMHEPEAKVKVRRAEEFHSAMRDRMTKDEFALGLELPWKKTRDLFRIRPNELTLWPGINGHGKSALIGQVMLVAMAQGAKVLIASMEMKPEATLERMYRQAFKGRDYNEEMALDFMDWSNQKLWMYDHVGSVKWQTLLGVMRYAHIELGIDQFVIDSLMRCGINDDDYTGQKNFVDALCTFRNDYPVHVHLVVHSKKLADEYAPPGKYDVKGSGTMTDLADNVCTVWRNKKKESAIAKPSHMRSPSEETAISGPDALLVVDKQRHHEWEGSIALWYVRGAIQFVETENGSAFELLEWGM
jgi:twinkle protein